MLESDKQTRAKARSKAQDRFTEALKRDDQLRLEREKRQTAQAAKTAKLRALRLAKEASDREIADSAAAVAEIPKKRGKVLKAG
jgi:hypothetical protein